LKVVLSDDVLSWRLRPNGTWVKVTPRKGVNAQVRLQELALERVTGRRR
jgi:hypothetical protein